MFINSIYISLLIFQRVPSQTRSSSAYQSSIYCAAKNYDDMTTPRWYQKTISITAPSRGCHLITSEIVRAVKDELPTIQIGMANIFIQHTSASLTINENADPDVRRCVFCITNVYNLSHILASILTCCFFSVTWKWL